MAHVFRSGWRYMLSGIAAALVLLGTAEALSVFFAAASAPLVSIGGAFIDIIPPWVKDAAIALFGIYDKIALFATMFLVVLILAAGIGLLARKHRSAALGAVVILGIGSSLVVVSRSGTTLIDVVPTLVGTVAGAVVLWALARLAQRAAGGSVEAAADDATGRRRFLLGTAGAAVVGVALLVAGRAASSARSGIAAVRDAIRLPAPAVAAPALPDGVSSPVPGMPPFVSPNDDFYRIDTALSVPRIDPSTWRLRIHGLVEQEIEIGFDELLAEDLVEADVTLTCVSNPVGGDLAGNARWLGVPVRRLLERAGVDPSADMVLSRSVDGFTAGTPIEALTDERNSLLAVGMNGEPLPAQHGFPVRMVVPGLYGYVSATKWLEDLKVTRFADDSAYWTDRGWSAEGPIKLASRVDVPRSFASVPAGEVMIGGTAWAQQRGISAVEVQIDDGEWQAATLAADGGADSWRQWSFAWDGATPGRHSVTVRATDGDGELQTSERADPVPDGASGWHRIEFTVQDG
ncbi:molybdopterin-dependent oxidoreductase [Zhihengliuella halotolerans]|uniref:DMSO/TMAO reductase YedYZ molybdopterin-dependent catalytic subunit n=1 Tax=Zhihengliuella halotolerans TaxID=370736 RepID=A0A4Q8AG08_9MICC|nr:molybdopterin-dependent oxidoreductase [Zhihengliuella halotolerans]RZU62633.1 DMSO/TMAO reductase YedYZ molybdopterin-dependent catalytic subunit [Zhihengliuella halotolerans]